MDSYKEETVIIDGVESWFECLVYEGTFDDAKNAPLMPYFHYHDYIELLYSLETDAVMLVNDEKYDFKSGDMIIVNSNELHFVKYYGRYKYLCVKFLPNILYGNEQAVFEYKYALPFLSNGTRKRHFKAAELRKNNIDYLCHEIRSEWLSHEYTYEMIIRANILKIFSYILRRWKRNEMHEPDWKISDSVKKAILYITKNFDTATELSTAEYCGLSCHYFSRLFKKETGKTFKEFLLSVRMKEAEKLLLSTDKSITEIAMDTGYATASHFIADFKKRTGTTPKTFQHKMKYKLNAGHE